MAINLTSYTQPISFVRKTTHATAGNLDLITFPTNCKCVTIKAAGSGDLKLTHTGSQDAAIGTDYFLITNGAGLTLKNMNLPSIYLRITGTVNGDAVEFILESALEAI